MKKIIIVFMTLICLTGCFSKNKLTDEQLNKREEIVEKIGKTDKEKFVVKYKNNNKEDCYYVYIINNNENYTQYQYTFYNSKDNYEKGVKDFSNEYYKLKKYDDEYVTYVELQNINNTKDQSIYKLLNDKYKNDKKYEIIK